MPEEPHPRILIISIGDARSSCRLLLPAWVLRQKFPPYVSSLGSQPLDPLSTAVLSALPGFCPVLG